MTKEEWLAATDPKPMMKSREGKASNRKLRLFLVASARIVWEQIPQGEMQDAVNESERFADSQTTSDGINDYRGRFYRYVMMGATKEQYDWSHSPDKKPIFTLFRMTTYTDPMVQTLSANENWHTGIVAYHPFLPSLLRDIFGNPFRPITFHTEWRTPTVLALATGIYEEKAFDRMPILADALQDANCSNEDMLNHCRGPGPHTRGCFAIDLILGKE
jgi:hypothetical protein